MRTTVNLDMELLDQAQKLTRIASRSELVNAGLRALVQLESAKRLALLGGSDPEAKAPPRRRPAR